MGCGSSKIDAQSSQPKALNPVELKSLDDVSDLDNDESLADIRAEILSMSEGEVFLMAPTGVGVTFVNAGDISLSNALNQSSILFFLNVSN